MLASLSPADADELKGKVTDIRVPTLGAAGPKATVTQWFKKTGEAVAVDEPLLELDTDMATIEVPAPATGVLGGIVAKEGAKVAAGALLGRIDGPAPAAASPPVKSSAASLSPDHADAGAPDSLSIVKDKLARLKSEAGKLGAPRVAGAEQLAGQTIPLLYFGQTKISGNGSIVSDLIGRIGGGKLTVFARNGDKFIAVATNTAQTGRAVVGQPLSISGDLETTLRAGQGVYGGRVPSDDSPAQMMLGLEPIRDGKGAVIGAYEVGLSPAQYCSAAHVLFPHGQRPLLTVDGVPATDLRGTTEIIDCNEISLSWSDGCSRTSVTIAITTKGDVMRPDRATPACSQASVPIDVLAFTMAIPDVTHWRVDEHGTLLLEGAGHELVFGPGKVN